MNITLGPAAPGDAPALAALFGATFAASDGTDEGARIAALVTRLLATGAIAFAARHGAALVGGVLFTPLTYPDPRRVMMLSPMAVATPHQGRGLGKALIRHALHTLRAGGTDIVVTYGDPAFYHRTGFHPVTTATIPAPQPLSMPQGWQAQSLTGTALTPLPGPATADPAFDDPALW